MPTIIVRHTVKDFDAWKPYFDEHAAARERYGIHVGGLYRDAEEPQNVVLVLETDDIDRAREFFGSDELRETMQKSGVVSEPSVWILNAA